MNIIIIIIIGSSDDKFLGFDDEDFSDFEDD